MKYCSQCGHSVIRKIPEGEELERFVCESCQTIHYQNPKVVAGSIPEWEDKILLCKRAIEPRYGLWTLPAGFMELGETLEQAAARETWEEAQARIDQLDLYLVCSLPHISQVYTLFRANLQDLNFAPGQESLEVKLFDESQIPWDQLAFPVIRQTLRHYFEDKAKKQFTLHVTEVERPPR